MRRFIHRWSSAFAQRRFYWRILAVFRRGRFYIGKRAFGFKSSASNTFTKLSIFLALARAAIPVLLLAILCVVALLGLTVLGERLATIHQWPSWITSLFEVVGQQNQAAYDGFLIAIITVPGVFLTLYFTGLSTLVETLYAKMPERIRNLLIQERVGNVYTRFLIFLTIVSMILLIVGMVGNFRPKTTILLIGFLGVISVQAFAELGERAFKFSDPTVFINTLLWELGRWSRQATTKGHLWNDPSFQDHYRQQAHEVIGGIRALVEVSHEESHLRREALSNLLAKILVFLPIYLERKRHIPSNSRWYRFTPHHKEWYLSSYTSVDLATRTQTGIQPEMKPDPHWVEEELLDVEVESLERCFRDGRTTVALRIMTNMVSLFEILGAEWEVEYGSNLLSRITKKIEDSLIQAEPIDVAGDGGSKQAVETLAAFDLLALLPISLLLGLAKELDGIDVEAISVVLARVKWERAKAIYDLEMPTPMLERLEFVQQRLEFERRAEGRVISPDWYLKQLVFQPMADSLHQQLDGLIEVLSNFYVHQAKQLSEKGQHLLASGFISRGLEFCNKALTYLSKAQKVAESLETLRVLPTLPWPEWNWEATSKEFSDAQELLITYLAQCTLGLAAFDRTEDIPDYFGQTVHLTGEWCFQALVTNNSGLFSKIFPNYFLGTLGIRDILREKIVEWRPEDAVAAFSEPLIDLCELSGYAYLLAELHGEPRLWETCSSIWEGFFQNFEQGLGLVAGTIAYYRQIFGRTHRAILRTQWEMQIDHLFRSLPRQREPMTHSRSVIPVIPLFTEIVDHPSLLVRVMGGIYSDYTTSMYDGLDIFVDLYLKQKPEAQNLDFGRHHDLLDQLERWRRNEEQDSASQPDSDEIEVVEE